MVGLSAKVFRTFNASYTFQDQLRKLTPEDGSVIDKFAAYTRKTPGAVAREDATSPTSACIALNLEERECTVRQRRVSR